MPLHIDEILDGDRHPAEWFGKIGLLRIGEGEFEIVREVTADRRVARFDFGRKAGEGVDRREIACGVGGTETGNGESRGIHGRKGTEEGAEGN